MTQEEFKNLPIEEQRCLVASDIITNVNAGTYVPTTAGYVILPNDKVEEWNGSQLQSHIKELKSCQACAVGCAFISLINFTNDYKVNENSFMLYSYYNASKAMAKLIPSMCETFEDRNVAFWGKQLDLIEVAYMGSYSDCLQSFASEYTDENGYTNTQIRQAIIFGEAYQNNGDRLVAIMENVVKNRGTFIP